ncbi:PREDICTED: DBH-like monooxygenase protein 1 isoform X1 [Acropora digitifera]|uniref:DBH-like monooxygenase protein 1 isoform X1 n=1 Tax=Acropora digitifera TaxID=70779 RepID=UPI00077B130A|nr:PREDICTED: DBH-like monooxygenase protein 1 isoform X1 [Acropora digitifera]
MGKQVNRMGKMLSSALSAAFLLHIFLVHAVAADLLSAHRFFASLDEDQSVKLYWNVTTTNKEIFFTVEAKTTGWIGFGISSGQGKMQGADIVIGWVKDGVPYFQDRHADGHMMPEIDSQQDYELISLTEENGKTVMKFKRKFDTCDADDNKIEPGTTKVIYAYHPSDPSTERSIPQHSPVNRGARSVLLLNSGKKRPALPPGTKYFDLVHNKTAIPGDKTSYMCVALEMPKLNETHHIIQMDPIVQAGHEGVVHHIVVYDCRDDYPDHHLNYTGRCYSSDMPPPVARCAGRTTIAGWAIGGNGFSYPEHVGFPIGTPNSPKVVILEIHYDNPMGKQGMIDSSGLRFYYTKQLRKYDAGVLFVGAFVDYRLTIPPKETNWQINGFCSEECTREGFKNSFLPGGGVNIVASLLHMHLAGRKAVVRRIRNGVEHSEIARDDHYDFNFQEYLMLENEIHVASGDSLITECFYNTRDRNLVTTGGLGTTDEMCLAFLIYYPKVNLSKCISREAQAWKKWDDKYVREDYEQLRKPTFWTESNSEGLREAFKDTDQYFAKCLSRADTALPGLAYKETKKPLIKIPYRPESVCAVSMATSIVPQCLGGIIALAFWVAIR